MGRRNIYQFCNQVQVNIFTVMKLQVFFDLQDFGAFTGTFFTDEFRKLSGKAGQDLFAGAKGVRLADPAENVGFTVLHLVNGKILFSCYPHINIQDFLQIRIAEGRKEQSAFQPEQKAGNQLTGFLCVAGGKRNIKFLGQAAGNKWETCRCKHLESQRFCFFIKNTGV